MAGGDNVVALRPSPGTVPEQLRALADVLEDADCVGGTFVFADSSGHVRSAMISEEPMFNATVYWWLNVAAKDVMGGN